MVTQKAKRNLGKQVNKYKFFRSVFIPSLVAKRIDLEITFADYKKRHVLCWLTN